MCLLHLRLWRCLRLVNMLQSRIGYSTGELAREFEVSERTIYRDLRLLEKSGIPVRYDPQRRGHVLLYPMDLSISKLSSDELTSLLLAAQVFSLSCVPQISRALHQAIGKLLAQMPILFREEISHLLNSIRGDLSSPSWSEGQQSIVAEILTALRQKQQIRIIYDSEETTCAPLHTKVTPNGLMISEGCWYLIGRSSQHRKVFRFDLRHIRMAEQVDNSHEPPAPPHIDLKQWNGPNIASRDCTLSAPIHSGRCL